MTAVTEKWPSYSWTTVTIRQNLQKTSNALFNLTSKLYIKHEKLKLKGISDMPNDSPNREMISDTQLFMTNSRQKFSPHAKTPFLGILFPTIGIMLEWGYSLSVKNEKARLLWNVC